MKHLKKFKETIIKNVNEGHRLSYNDEFREKTDSIINSLSNINDDDDLYNVAYAIAPKIITKSLSRVQILDIIEDVLLARF